ncbi:MAG TPA: hypothetical protein VMT54_19005, partial [Candidatus Cybelea sp.]|nr:hypothetical protein [Candidatus Cybelea sp.]
MTIERPPLQSLSVGALIHDAGAMVFRRWPIAIGSIAALAVINVLALVVVGRCFAPGRKACIPFVSLDTEGYFVLSSALGVVDNIAAMLVMAVALALFFRIKSPAHGSQTVARGDRSTGRFLLSAVVFWLAIVLPKAAVILTMRSVIFSAYPFMSLAAIWETYLLSALLACFVAAVLRAGLVLYL